MGNISSRLGEGEGPHLRDQNRFSVASVVISNSSRVLFHVTPNAYPASRYNVRRESGDDSIVEYVQDPESTNTGVPLQFLLRLPNEDELTFTFTFVIRQGLAAPQVQPAQSGAFATVPTIDTVIKNLTHVFASSTKEMEQLINVEFHADPNLHRNPNVHLVGDFTTGGVPSVQANWTWKWKPPKAMEDRGGGWRNTCSFVEYDQRAHRLSTLATFSFWVQNAPRLPRTPNLASPRLDISTPQRLRLPSTQSLDSRLSESDGNDAKDGREPQSPMFDPIPENNLGPVPPLSSTKNDAAGSRPGDDLGPQEPNDLLFQAAKRDFEQRTSNIRAKWKKVLKKADAALEAQQASNNAMADLVEVLRETFASNASGVNTGINSFFDKTAKDLLRYERDTTSHMKTHIIEPISKLYTTDIKQAESRRKDFDEKEKEYNAWVRWYLGKTETSLKDKKRAETDSKYQAKKKNFELKRFDYTAFIEDLQGGRKDQEVFYHLFQYAEAQTKRYLDTAERIEQLKPQRDALRLEIKQANDEFELQRRQREEKRRALETSSKSFAESSLSPAPPNTTAAMSQIANTKPPVEDPIVNRTSVKPLPSPLVAHVLPVPAIPNPAPSTHEKEGVLFALSRPGSHADPRGLNKQAWHKFWIVLNKGRLLEYINWKVAPELQMEIDLRVAAVREARGSDRRFCLEVQTPQFTRVYQDTSEEGVKSWISAMNNAIQNALESQASSEVALPAESQTEQPNLNIATALTGKPTKHYSLSNHRMSYQGGPAKTSGTPSRYNTTGGNSRLPSTQDTPLSPLLQQIRDADRDNMACADCGEDKDKVDWVSINLGIVICFRCSGAHRSLGTDVSKVRSLTLDTTPFTPDVVELLLKVGNRVSNNIWEARLDHSQKIGPSCSPEQRQQFVTAKYRKKLYVRRLSEAMPHCTSAVEPLITSVKKNDLPGVLYALAVPKALEVDDFAEVNASTRFAREAVDPSRRTSPVYLALAAADPASPAATVSPLHSPSSAPANRLPNSASRPPFAVAELLLLNMFRIPDESAPFPLSQGAQLYLEQKRGKQSMVPLVPVEITTDGQPFTALPPYSGANNERSRSEGKLQKRISTSGKSQRPP